MDKRGWIKIALSPVIVMTASAYATDYFSIPQAQELMFPEAQSFIDVSIVFTNGQKKEIKSLSGVKQRWDKQLVWRAEKNGQLQGWFMVDEVIGKHEFISYAVAVNPDGKVLGVEILSYRETHGGQIRSPEWREHFQGKTLNDRFKLNVDVPNISGATLSCRNVTDGVRRLLAIHKVVLSKEKASHEN